MLMRLILGVCYLLKLLFLWHLQQACHSGLGSLGGSVTKCEACQTSAYCSPSCRQVHVGVHRSYCYLLQELGTVFNVDLDRFVHYVPFRNWFGFNMQDPWASLHDLETTFCSQSTTASKEFCTCVTVLDWIFVVTVIHTSFLREHSVPLILELQKLNSITLFNSSMLPHRASQANTQNFASLRARHQRYPSTIRASSSNVKTAVEVCSNEHVPALRQWPDCWTCTNWINELAGARHHIQCSGQQSKLFQGNAIICWRAGYCRIVNKSASDWGESGPNATRLLWPST
jgi:hypothetical protein